MIYQAWTDKLKEVSTLYPARKDKDFLQKISTYNNKKNAVILGFRKALEQEYRTAGNDKATLLWDKCWDMGHSVGLLSIENYYADLADLIT